MRRVWAFAKRDLRKFFRNSGILAFTLFLPLAQVFVVGYAIGGKIQDVPVGLVDLDGGPAATRLKEAFLALEASARTLRVLPRADLDAALRESRRGALAGVVVIPADYSRHLVQGRPDQPALLVDNSDPMLTAAITEAMRGVAESVERPEAVLTKPARPFHSVELFDFIEYIQYLVPTAVTLGVYLSCLVGGGWMYVDDRHKGYHEGYLATPVAGWQILAGLTLSGVLKASFSGFFVACSAIWMAGLAGMLHVSALLSTGAFLVLVSLALVSFINLFMVRVRDPLVARTLMAGLNVVLLFPSGAIYPIAGFPAWLKALSVVDPFTYAIRGFHALLLRGAGLAAVSGEILVLLLFTVLAWTGAWLLFPRRL